VRASAQIERVDDEASLHRDLERVAAWREIVDDVRRRKWAQMRAEYLANTPPADLPSNGVEEILVQGTLGSYSGSQSMSATSRSHAFNYTVWEGEWLMGLPTPASTGTGRSDPSSSIAGCSP
jgi:hypothetical protein